MGAVACELCGACAAVRCEPDAAFLCWDCDALVHGANFLVARHVRHPVCADCGRAACAVSGPRLSPGRFVCSGCAGGGASDSESSNRCGSDSGSSGGSVYRGAVVRRARRVGMRRVRAAPRRAVAAMWLAAGRGEAAVLRRLEGCARPRVVLAAAARLARGARAGAADDSGEGWAECA